MILLFFSVWAIAIALNEVLFAAQPFTINSIVSALPHTLVFSALLSAAVYLAKTKIMDAIHKGRPIDKKFVAEITPEVGHELNKMRQKIADYEEGKKGQWREGVGQPAQPQDEFQGEGFVQAQELFNKLSAAAAKGPIDPNDPDLQSLIAKAKEQGLDIQDIVAIAADQSIPVFPELPLPGEKAQSDQAQDYGEGISNLNLNQSASADANTPPLDPAQVAAAQQNIDNVLDKYRDLDRLAAAPELATTGLVPEPEASAPLSLGPETIQPIKAINIQEREYQQALEQARAQQRRSAQIDALAQVASDEDQIIAQYKAAAAQGNQLARAQAMAKAQAQAQAQTVASQAQAQTAATQAHAAKTALTNTLSPAEQVVQAVQMKSQAIAAAKAQNVSNSAGSTQPTEIEIYKARFAKLGDKNARPSGLLRNAPEVEEEEAENGLFDGYSSVKDSPQEELFDGYEPQDQVINDPSLPELNTKTNISAGSVGVNAKIRPKVRPKDPDAPSLVDTSNLKKYKYVPPKKGAGLDTSALKKVTLPNYNRHDGPSRLGSSNKMRVWSFKSKSSAVSTASLSSEERQELISRMKKTGTQEHRLNPKLVSSKSGNWLHNTAEANLRSPAPRNRSDEPTRQSLNAESSERERLIQTKHKSNAVSGSGSE